MEKENTNSNSICNALNGLELDNQPQEMLSNQLAASPNIFDNPPRLQIDKKEESTANPPKEEEEEKKQTFTPQGLVRNPALKRKSSSQIIQEDLKRLKTSLYAETSSCNNGAPVTVQLRKKYTDETKLQVAELAKKIGPAKVSRLTGLPETSVRRWKQSDSIKVKVGRKPQYLDIEEELARYFFKLRSQGLQVTNRVLINEARKIAASKNYTNFAGSSCWLDGFKNRTKITYRKMTRISQKIREESIEKLKQFQANFIRLTNQHRYDSAAIINIDETGICFDSPSNYTLEYKVSY